MQLAITGVIFVCISTSTVVYCQTRLPNDVDMPTVRSNVSKSLSPKFPWDENTKRKINVLAAHIDIIHGNKIEYLESHYKNEKQLGTFTEPHSDAIAAFLRGEMVQNLNENNNETLVLVNLTQKYNDEDRRRTAAEIAKHFAEDHVLPYTYMLIKHDENFQFPEWAKNVAKKISYEAMNNVYKLFNLSLENKN